MTSPVATGSEQLRFDRLVRNLTEDPGTLPPPRWLLVFAHPDDEVLALGAHLERLGASRILTVTDGAPSDGTDARHHGFASLDAYRAARREELFAALAHAGLPPEVAPAFPLQIPDQQASLHLAPITRAIASAMHDFHPEAVLTHPFEGGHPDHDACAFAVHTAVQLLASNPLPVLLEAPSYHAGSNGAMITGAFLPHPEATHELRLKLTEAQQQKKAERLACFASQAETLNQFGLQAERLRVAPHYDFTRPPHPGQLFYERFPWGMTGARFAELASEALRELQAPSSSSQHTAPSRARAAVAL